jgi:hypothetical protein
MFFVYKPTLNHEETKVNIKVFWRLIHYFTMARESLSIGCTWLCDLRWNLGSTSMMKVFCHPPNISS